MPEHSVHTLDKRVTALETRNQVDDVHRANILSRLDKIEGGVSRLMWIVIAAVLLALLDRLFTSGSIG
jgi:hypothetical protein